MKIVLPLLLLILSTVTFSQTKGWMVLQKKDRSITTYFPGKFIRFQLDNYQWIEGTIKFFRNDSIFITQQIARIVPNAWGLPIRDTLQMGLLEYNIKEIYALPIERFESNFMNGTLLQAGGAGYIFLNAVNSLINGQDFFAPENLSGIGIAAGVFLFGKFLQWNHPTKIIVGKKYKLHLIKID